MSSSTGTEADRPPEQRRWTWEHPVGPRWLLLGDIGFKGSYKHDIPLALCADIEGLQRSQSVTTVALVATQVRLPLAGCWRRALGQVGHVKIQLLEGPPDVFGYSHN